MNPRLLYMNFVEFIEFGKHKKAIYRTPKKENRTLVSEGAV